MKPSSIAPPSIKAVMIWICIFTVGTLGLITVVQYILRIDETVRVLGIHKPIRTTQCDPCHNNWTKDRWKFEGKHN